MYTDLVWEASHHKHGCRARGAIGTSAPGCQVSRKLPHNIQLHGMTGQVCPYDAPSIPGEVLPCHGWAGPHKDGKFLFMIISTLGIGPDILPASRWQ